MIAAQYGTAKQSVLQKCIGQFETPIILVQIETLVIGSEIYITKIETPILRLFKGFYQIPINKFC